MHSTKSILFFLRHLMRFVFLMLCYLAVVHCHWSIVKWACFMLKNSFLLFLLSIRSIADVSEWMCRRCLVLLSHTDTHIYKHIHAHYIYSGWNGNSFIIPFLSNSQLSYRETFSTLYASRTVNWLTFSLSSLSIYISISISIPSYPLPCISHCLVSLPLNQIPSKLRAHWPK